MKTQLSGLKHLFMTFHPNVLEAHLSVGLRTLRFLLFLAVTLGLQAASGAVPPDEALLPVWRAQVRIAIADVATAGTDNDVNVQLKQSNVTWLDSGDNDFERGTDRTYDLRLDNVSTLADINSLTLSKVGGDGLCLRRVELIINGQPAIFSREFGNTSSTCLPLDNVSGLATTLTIPFPELRSHSAWTAYTDAPPFPVFTISRPELESRVESIFGDFRAGRDLQWGQLHGRAVEATRKDDQTVYINLDMKLFGGEVDVEFDLRVVCIELVQEGSVRSEQVTFEINNQRLGFDRNFSGNSDIRELAKFLDNTLSTRINGTFKTYTHVISTITSRVPLCPPILVTAGAAISFAAVGVGKPPPVIIVPGLGASALFLPAELENTSNHGWPLDVTISVLTPASLSGDPENLQFTEFGEPRRDTISHLLEPGCCIASRYGGGEHVIFFSRRGFAVEAQLLGSISKLTVSLQKAYNSINFRRMGQFVTAWPHDFRFSISNNAEDLDRWVDFVMDATGSKQVDLVGHSRGALVIKEYLNNHPERIRAAVLIAPPNLGAPKLLKALRYGDNLDQPLLDDCKLKRAAHNMPGVLNLLPGSRWLQDVGAYIYDQTFGGGGAGGAIGVGMGDPVTNFEHLLNYLKFQAEYICPMQSQDAGPLHTLSPGLLDVEFARVHESRDNWKRPPKVKVFAIVGYNNKTTRAIVEYLGKPNQSNPTGHRVQLLQGDGDGTVPIESAKAVDATEVYYADVRGMGVEHDSMLGSQEILDQVFNLLHHPEGTMPGVYGPHIKRGETPVPLEGGITITTFSSVRLHVFSSQGVHTGLRADGSIEKNIPGSSFDQVSGQQFVTVPEGDEYEVIIEGMGEGPLQVWQTDFDATGLPLRTLEWYPLPMKAGSLYRFDTRFGEENPVIAVDFDGDTYPESMLPTTSRFAGGGGPMHLADLNRDGRVDSADLAIVRASFGTRRNTPRYNPIADVNHDGIVDIRDYAWVSRAMTG